MSDGDAAAAAIIGSFLMFFVVGLVVELLIAFWAMKVATGKGRSGALGFCLGFFLGLIGVVIAYVMGPSAEVQLQRMEQQAEVMERARQRVSNE